MRNGQEVNSNFFVCGCNENPTALGEVEVGAKPDNYTASYMNSVYKNYVNINQISTELKQNNNKFYKRLHSSGTKNNKLNSKTNLEQILNTFVEEDYKTFDTSVYDNNPKIIQLKNLINNQEFILTEKEDYEIKSAENNPNLLLKVLKFDDETIYKGYVTKDNKRQLFGTFYFKNGNIYHGFFNNDNFNGHGRLYNIDNFIYDGEFSENLFQGYGRLNSVKGINYEGLWKNNIQEGYGKELYEDGSSYIGNYKKGMKNGKGKFIWSNGNIYEGDFVNDEIVGWGTCKWEDGRIYIGQWKNHLMNGRGIFIWKDGKIYIGEYLNGIKEGYGIFYDNSNKYVDCFWKNGKQNGYSIIKNQLNNNKYYALYEDGKKKGQNILKIDEQDEIERQMKAMKEKIEFEKLIEIKNKTLEEMNNKNNDNKDNNKDNINNNKDNINNLHNINIKNISNINNINNNINNINNINNNSNSNLHNKLNNKNNIENSFNNNNQIDKLNSKHAPIENCNSNMFSISNAKSNSIINSPINFIKNHTKNSYNKCYKFNSGFYSIRLLNKTLYKESLNLINNKGKYNGVNKCFSIALGNNMNKKINSQIKLRKCHSLTLIKTDTKISKMKSLDEISNTINYCPINSEPNAFNSSNSSNLKINEILCDNALTHNKKEANHKSKIINDKLKEISTKTSSELSGNLKFGKNNNIE